MKDAAYEMARNELIPEAERVANAKVKALGKEDYPTVGVDGGPLQWCYFTEFFHAEMNRLAEGLKC